MEKLKLNKEYTYSFIVEYAKEMLLVEKELGTEIVGEHFIILYENNDTVYSFILTGTRAGHYIYELTYTA